MSQCLGCGKFFISDTFYRDKKNLILYLNSFSYISFNIIDQFALIEITKYSKRICSESIVKIQHYPINNNQCFNHIRASQLICKANQFTGFYMMETLVINRLVY